MQIAIAVLIMILGYGIALVLIVRAFIVAFSLRKDVPWVPSSSLHVREGLELLELKAGDNVVDPGSGNGKFILYASRRHPDVQFTGIELNGFLVMWSNFKARLQGRENVKFIHGSVFDHDYSAYNKVYLFLTRNFTQKLMEKMAPELQNGAVVVASSFGFGDEFEKSNKFEEKYFKTTLKHNKLSVWRKV